MRNIILFLLVSITLSCNKEDDVFNFDESNVSLISPKGIAIAQDVDDLKTRINESAISAFGKKQFFIKKIDFKETSTQVAAIIEFMSVDNEFGSVLIIGDVGSSVANGRISRVMGGTTVVDCAGGCNAQGDTCRERAIVSGNTITYECTCTGTCKMTINQQ